MNILENKAELTPEIIEKLRNSIISDLCSDDIENDTKSYDEDQREYDIDGLIIIGNIDGSVKNSSTPYPSNDYDTPPEYDDKTSIDVSFKIIDEECEIIYEMDIVEYFGD